ncbi:hypothetical protein [Flavihumibacter sp. UBA7668]|uniref:hypothetical protein n=1 Tax=Flavihumibacter sp. UBA7668 TaxID=1946542 RepID=UPI0025C36984|nr:hypothetical protein [Flavihumibacter sp. UBA7668]
MKSSNTNRQRFHKPYHFMQLAEEAPFEALAELFHNFSLDNFRQELATWKTLAISNKESIYDDPDSINDLQDFIQELLKLIEAFYLLNKEKNKQYFELLFTALPKETRQKIADKNRPILLTEEEKSNPAIILQQFKQTFTKTYVHIELLDMLEAIITHEGDNHIDKSNLILYYQQFHFLTGLAIT